MQSKTSNLLDEFRVLAAASKQRALSAAEARHLELLRDVLVELSALPPVQAAGGAEAAAPAILVRLSDAAEQAAVAEALRQAGVEVKAEPGAAKSAIVVVDTGTALGFVGAKLVLMNVSGPDALVGRLASLEPAAFVKRRAPVAEVVEAVTGLLAAT